MADTIGTAQAFATPQAWHDDIGADAAVARVGLVSVDEELSGILADVSDANDVGHRLGAASGVRHDGSGAQVGARMSSTGTTVSIVTNNFIVEDLIIIHTGATGNRRCVAWAGGDRSVVRRNVLLNFGTSTTGRLMEGSAVMDDVEIYLNNMFGNFAGVLQVQLGVSGTSCKLICNTVVNDAAVELTIGINVEPGAGPDWTAHGNYVQARTNAAGTEYVNSPNTGQKNAGEDGTAFGDTPIDITTDLGLGIDDIIVSDALASIDLRRVEANHGGVAQEVGVDLDALGIPAIDVTGNAFDNTNPIFGAHQIAIIEDDDAPQKEGLGFGLGVGLDAFQ